VALVGAGLWFDGAGPPLIGRAQVTDGDTLRLAGQRVRLTGLDAPELDQTCVGADGREWSCGAAARLFVAELLKGSDVNCRRSGRDVYRRVLASCTTDGQDIGARIVGAGWAVAEFGYGVEEGEARAARRGIWSGSFTAPAEWRHNHGVGTPSVWDWIRSWFQ
jgi:endonuclease YncB( thermonuclease family)